jgi:hypothetical protein
MKYFQRTDIGSDIPTRWGVFRRSIQGEWQSDEKYNLRSRSWERTLDLQHILSGRRDGDVVEVSEADIRAFLATKMPSEEVEGVLAASPLGLNPGDRGNRSD